MPCSANIAGGRGNKFQIVFVINFLTVGVHTTGDHFRLIISHC
jgi:hypothetical protein